MGTPLPPNLPADPCVICWGSGKPFGDTPTPRVIFLRLTFLSPGEFWVPAHEQLLLTPHLLEQQAFPCNFTIDDGIFFWTVFWTVASTQIDVFRIADNKSAFRKGTVIECATGLPSQHLTPAGVVAFNGFASITWNPEDL
jgi:hypothetical protein